MAGIRFLVFTCSVVGCPQIVHFHNIWDLPKHQFRTETVQAAFAGIIMYYDWCIRVLVVEILYSCLRFVGYRIQRGVDQNVFLQFGVLPACGAGGEEENACQEQQQEEAFLPTAAIPDTALGENV